MAHDNTCRLLVGIDVPDRFNTPHVDALYVESLQGPVRRARRTRSASTKQTAILFLSNKRKGAYNIAEYLTHLYLLYIYIYLINIIFFCSFSCFM